MRRLFLGFVLLIACGSAKPAESPDAAEPKGGYDDAEMEADMAGGDPAGGESAPSEKPPAGPVEATDADLKTILQLVLDDDALQPYLHLEEPERMPLKIHGDMLPTGLELTMARKPVQYVDATVAEDKKKAVLVFTAVEVKGDRASIAYRYDIEKVKGSATVVKSDGAWTLDKSRISTRDYKPSETK
ncbi:MAG TPA: hypothetical protein VM686_16970 [Polyangiaceae bacterium]|nr:hypothetical protein [Polyangiaceae bacterium]